MSPIPFTGGMTAAEIDARLPRKLFVKRGDLQRAFGLTRKELDGLVVMDSRKLTSAQKRAHVAAGRFVAEYPVAGYARFVRSQLLQVARQWEASE